MHLARCFASTRALDRTDSDHSALTAEAPYPTLPNSTCKSAYGTICRSRFVRYAMPQLQKRSLPDEALTSDAALPERCRWQPDGCSGIVNQVELRSSEARTPHEH